MISIFLFLIFNYFATFLFYAVIQKPLFCIYNKVPAVKIPEVVVNGYRSDTIAAAYLTAIPLIWLWVYALIPYYNPVPGLLVTEVLMGLIYSLSTIADTALYSFWNYKLDRSVLPYLKSLRGAFASVSAGYLMIAFGSVTLLTAVYTTVMWAGADLTHLGQSTPAGGWWKILWFLCFVLALGVLFLVTRGLGHHPFSLCDTIYTTKQLFNHAALNPLYSFLYSFTVKDEFKDRYKYFPEEACEREFATLFPKGGKTTEKLLNTDRPNIIFIMWESLCAHYIEPLGGKPGVTENFNRLSKEGIFFTRMDAGGTRTDIALPCLYCGYPGQTTTFLIRNTAKLPKLPGLPKRLRENGYSTTVIHGGRLSIMHKLDFYLAVGHDRVIEQSDFPEDSPTCSWGVHDNAAFERLFDEVQALDKQGPDSRWYITFQTLSSHQPYKVPYDKFSHEICNAFAFTDDALGRFVDRVKGTKAWENLLIIVVGDHGLQSTDEPLPRDKSCHVPLLLLGGAVKGPRRVDTIVSQSDIAATLLGQLGIDHCDFPFSRDVFADSYTNPSAINIFNNGFVMRDERGFTEFDCWSSAAVKNPDPERERIGKTILQKLYSELSRL